MTLLAFHNDPAIKTKYLARVRAHREADQLIKGTGWVNGKGCAIGCTLDAYDHARYPVELGVPEMLARLEDCIFEGLPNDLSQAWPERFLSAIAPGADLSRVGWQFLRWLLTRSGIGAYDDPLVRDSVKQCADVLLPLTRDDPAGTSAARSAASAAESAAWSARSAAWSAAESAARSAASAASAESAAWSAAWSAAASAESAAESAAWSARSAAWSAAESAAWSAASAESAESARSAAYTTMADQLIALLEAA